MAGQFEKSGSLTMERGLEVPAAEKPKAYEELGLCLALIAMVGWALYAGLHTLDWQAIGHAFKAVLSAIL